MGNVQTPRGNSPIVPHIAKSNLMWLYKAACRGEDPRIFFPSKETDPSVKGSGQISKFAWQKPRAICLGCTVIENCREEYWDFPTHKEGMLFAMTPQERRTYRRDRKRKSA